MIKTKNNNKKQKQETQGDLASRFLISWMLDQQVGFVQLFSYL